MAVVTGTTSSSSAEDKPPPKPRAEDFKGPVAWLFGRQLIANYKWIILYTAFKNKLDPRDWMNANIIPPPEPAAETDKFWHDWSEDWKKEDGNIESEKEFWFDYISDTGDGQKAVYSIAYLCMSDLAVSKNPEREDQVDFILQPDLERLEREGKLLLPRGAFLFVGGDTSYHISDYTTLANRFQNPFYWAYADLFKDKAQSVLGKWRLLLGIPGNHDYYDSLDGFNRQFRRPAKGDGVPPPGERPPLLAIHTFSRIQEASYMALRLPFDWWFWGLDTEEGEIDFRQLEFFDDIRSRYKPKKLIVATPEPTTVFGKYAREDENQSKTFKALGLERAFLKKPEPLGEGKCRIDLSGDVHHYSRHWGPGSTSPDAGRYASVMAGGGGAFLHPTQTTIREVKPVVIYPPPEESRKIVANEVFKFMNIWKGGFVWLGGFLIAFSIFFAASFPQSSKDAVDSVSWLAGLGISTPIFEQQQGPAYVKPMPRYTWAPNAKQTPQGFFLWMISLGLSIALLGAALYYSSRLFKKVYDPRKKERIKVTLPQRVLLWALVFASFGCLIFGLWQFHLNEPMLTRFGRSVIIMVALLWSVLAIVESLWYSEWLFEESYAGNLEWWHYWPLWILIIMSVLGFGSSLWFFGKHEAAYLISDLWLLLVLLGVGGGLVYFAWGTGANLKKGAGKVAFLLLGVSHALLQLAVPFLLVRKGHWLLAPIAALAVVFIFQYLGSALARMKDGWPLAIAWVVFGALLIIIPFVLHAALYPLIFPAGALNMPDNPWLKLLLCFYAGIIGALMSCVLFGWYLGVSLAFNGHNNEAGGAARIEGYKQIIRFRINRHGLTGYVIGIDEPNTEGGLLHPKIIDVFHLCEK